MATPNRPLSQNKYTEQNMGNTSFDEDFGVNAVEILGYNSANGGSLERIKTTSGVISTSIDTTGLATSAKQDTGNTSLASIDGKITAVNTGAVVVASGSITASQAGTWTVDTELPAAATIAADGVTPTVPGAAAYAFLKTPGAATWDRWYSTVHGANTTGTGIGSAGLMAEFDDTSPTSITENQFGNLRISANRNLYSTIRDAAGNERGMNVDANGAIAATVTNATASNLKAAATLDAETTKVIGVVRTADGSGNLYTTNSTTYTAKFGQDNNLLGTLGTAFSTAGKVDVKVASGDIASGAIAAGAIAAGGASFVKLEDAASVGGDAGVPAMAIQTATPVDTAAEGDYVMHQMSAGRLWTAANIDKMNGVAVSMGVGATGTGVQRVVQANDTGKTIVSKTGSAASSGNNTLVAAGTNKLKVFAFSLTTSSTTAVTVKFQDGASGTDLWSVILQAPTSVTTGANLAVSPPAYLFATSAATLLNLNLSSANAVQWSVSYYDEA